MHRCCSVVPLLFAALCLSRKNDFLSLISGGVHRHKLLHSICYSWKHESHWGYFTSFLLKDKLVFRLTIPKSQGVTSQIQYCSSSIHKVSLFTFNITMPLSFLNLERLRVLSACMVLMLAAVTVSSILSTVQMMKPIRILYEQVPITAEYHPAKFVIYKTFAPDGSLETVSQDSVHRKMWEGDQQQQQQQQQGGEMQKVEEGHVLDQVCHVCAVPTSTADHYVLYYVYYNQCYKGNCCVCERLSFVLTDIASSSFLYCSV
jgi:hypothetical protein